MAPPSAGKVAVLRELGKKLGTRLGLRQQPESTPPCRVCGAARSFYLCDSPNEHSASSPLRIHLCSACGSVFVANEIDGAELGIAYGSMDAERYFEEIEVENVRKMQGAIGRLDGLVERSARLLDIGAGNGRFVELLAGSGYTDLAAHEIPGGELCKLRAVASAVYEDFDYGEVPSDHFDVVTMLDVVEHVISPQYLIETCARVLKPGGLVYFHTPVVTRVDRVMHRLQALPGLRRPAVMWQRGRTSIFHLENYTARALALLLGRAGFHDIEIEVGNELSWPVERYVRMFLLRPMGLPDRLAPIIAPVAAPVLATDLMNANKAIVHARLA